MKNSIILLISLFSLSFVGKDISEDISNYIKYGKANELVKFFPEKVSIKVLSQEDFLSKSQAQVLLEDFFSKHKVKNYKSAHSTIVNGDQQFMTGSLETASGNYRISILVRANIISQFRIEYDN